MSILLTAVLAAATAAPLDILVSPLPERCSYADTRPVSLQLTEDAFEAQDAGESMKARDLFIESLEADDCNARSWLGLGSILLEQSWFGHAERALGRAVTLEPDAEVWLQIARAREGQRAWSAAESAYKRALSLSPKMTDARNGLRRMRDRRL